MSITDEQIAEIEALATDAQAFDWGPDIGMTHTETVYACSVGPGSILALISRLRAAEKDAGRYQRLRDAAVRDHGITADKFDSEFDAGLDAIDAAMTGEKP